MRHGDPVGHDRGEMGEAPGNARKLAELAPYHPGARQLVGALERRAG